MNNHSCGILRNKSMGYKKSGLIIIISLLSLIALSTHTFAEKLSFELRTPEEPGACESIRSIAKRRNTPLHEQLHKYTHDNCYSDLLGLLKTDDAKEEVKKCQYSLELVPDDLKGYMGLHLDRAPQKENYPSTYWDTFDLLYAHSDLENQEYFSYIIGSTTHQYFSANEMQYLAARFLSRENAVDKRIRNGQKPRNIHISLKQVEEICTNFLSFSSQSGMLNILMPFGVPLTRLDVFQLISRPFEELTASEQGQISNIEINGEALNIEMSIFRALFSQTQTQLENKLFIDEHKKAHEYLITELRRSAGKTPGAKGAIQVLERFNTEGAHKKAKTNRGKAITSPFVVKYSVITMGILREALRRGLNPNTLMLGIDFNYSTIRKALLRYETLFDGPDRHQSLLEWAAMGKIKDATPDEAVDLLLQAGANPHTLPETWNEVKQEWLKKWQTKVDSHDLPSPKTRYKLSDLMTFSPEIAVFMNNFQLYLDKISVVRWF